MNERVKISNFLALCVLLRERPAHCENEYGQHYVRGLREFDHLGADECRDVNFFIFFRKSYTHIKKCWHTSKVF